MKHSYGFLILICTFGFSSCNKKDIQLQQQMNGKVLSGVWELRAVAGGMLPYNPNDYKTGNGSLWTFTEKDFARIYMDSVYRSGNYSISRSTGTDLNTGRKIDQFIFNDQPSESFELRNDTLKFYYGAFAYDGNIEMYVKIAEDTTANAGH